MKGIGSYDVFRTAGSVWENGKKTSAEKKGNAKKAGKSESAAAEYKMSDKAKQVDPNQWKDYQRTSVSGMELEKKNEVSSDIKLSKAAQNLLKELKEKYGDIDFFVAEFSTDEEAQAYHRQSTKKYSCVIDPKTLEEMAADQSVKEKYTGIIDDATNQFEKLKEDLGDDAKEITRMGVNVDKDGVVSYFAEIKNQTVRMQQGAMEDAKARRAANKEQTEKLDKKRAEAKKEKQKAEQAKEEKAVREAKGADGKTGGLTKITASSMEELLAKLKEEFAGRTGAAAQSVEVKDAVPGQQFDTTM